MNKFKVKNGVLKKYIGLTEITIPDGITSINHYAFC